MSMRIGVDLGGTNIEAIALDEKGATLCRRRVPTPSGDYRAIIEAISALVAEIERETGCQGTVGVGTPGALSLRTGLIKNSNSTVLNGQPLDRDLAGALRRPVRLQNDANCFALSEALDGAGAGAESVFGVILGTGVGGGLVIEGRIVSGHNRIAGEWGHNPMPWPQPGEMAWSAMLLRQNRMYRNADLGAGAGKAVQRSERTHADRRTNRAGGDRR
jgi:fructokinase